MLMKNMNQIQVRFRQRHIGMLLIQLRYDVKLTTISAIYCYNYIVMSLLLLHQSTISLFSVKLSEILTGDNL